MPAQPKRDPREADTRDTSANVPRASSPPSPQTRSPAASTKSQIRLRPTSYADSLAHDGARLTLLADPNDPEAQLRPSDVQDTDQGLGRVPGEQGQDDDEDDDQDDDEQDSPFVRGRRIEVGTTPWDDSGEEDEDDALLDDEDDEQSDEDAAPLTISSAAASSTIRRKRPRRYPPTAGGAARRGVPRRGGAGGVGPDAVLSNLAPTRSRLRTWWRRLTQSNPAQASLSPTHVSLNLFSASLHPAVLLSMPAYFERTGYVAGVAGLVVAAILGGTGGGLWVVLSRYVGGNSVEAITGASFGRNTRWRRNAGRTISGLLLAVYATGAATIAYFALADLLLQLSFHYSPRGIPLHDRAFVTIVVGGLLTTPLVVFPLAKRTLIRLSTNLAVLLYPILLAILFVQIYRSAPAAASASVWDALKKKHGHGHGHAPSEPAPPSNPGDGPGTPTPPIDRHGSLPNFNPLQSPSVWASYSLLPLLTLSSSPLQILAHNRSLRRTGLSGSNVKAFMAAQAGQVVLVVLIACAFGVGIGTEGIKDRLGMEIHPNLFASLSTDDDLLNLARALFVLLLSSHLSLCLVTARSSWGRLLRLFHLNPLRRRLGGTATATQAAATRTRGAAATSASTSKPPRQWGKLARNSLAGALLWGVSASASYFGGVGGLRRSEKAGEEARFTRAEEVLGLAGAAVGFVIPAIVWIILFHVRRPRAILPVFATEVGRSASAWFMGPLSALARSRRQQQQQQRNAGAEGGGETEPLLAAERDSSRAEAQGGGTAPVPVLTTWTDDEALGDTRDAATRILLARKEKQLQRRTRGRRLYQDVIVLAGILPLGVALIVLGALDLSHSPW